MVLLSIPLPSRSYKSGGRDDLVAKEQEELDVYSSYLPKMLSREELEVIVNEAVVKASATSLKDMKKVMTEVRLLRVYG